MRIKLTSIMVDDQDKAERFYTQMFGFVKKQDIPVGGGLRWLTVASPDRDDLELALEPNSNPAARAFQDAMFSQGIPLAAFEADDLEQDFQRLKGRGVAFTQAPTRMGPVMIAVCADTCGNLIQLYQRL